MQDGLYARFDTSAGEILVQLEMEKTPITVANFVGLAEGTIKNTAKVAGAPYYDGLKFHRVIADFMIQGGCPQGRGTGGPGYQFADEFDASLTHNAKGILSMANAGPGTNGSQFFITHVATPWLDNKHTVFGHVIEGEAIVDKIKQGDSINKLSIERVGSAAEAFDANAIFEARNAIEKKKEEDARLAQEAQMADMTKNATKTNSGLQYEILEEGKGPKPKKGDLVSVHYAGFLLNGQKFDSSFDRNEPIEINIGTGQVIRGWDEGIMLLNEGAKARLIIPSNLGYGPQGAGGVIPPNATLVFEVQLVKIG